MSVDFSPCSYCEETFCECGPHVRCVCERLWCSERCARADGYEKYDEDTGDSSCSYCRNEEAEDSHLLEFMLKIHKVSREDVLKEWQKTLPKEE